MLNNQPDVQKIWPGVYMIGFFQNFTGSVSFKPFAGAGFGIENPIGLRGINLQGGAEIYLAEDLTGIAGVDLFLSQNVSKWGNAVN